MTGEYVEGEYLKNANIIKKHGVRYNSKAMLVLTIFLSSIILTTLVSFGVVFSAKETKMFDGGDGSAERPYIVSSAVDLYNVRYETDKFYRQSGNIDMAGIQFSPIGHSAFPFSGSYDGGQYTIENLSIDSGSSDTVGLFAYNTGSITGVNLLTK